MARKAPKDWANAVPKEKAMWAKENHKIVFLRPSQLSDRKPAAQLIRNTCETHRDRLETISKFRIFLINFMKPDGLNKKKNLPLPCMSLQLLVSERHFRKPGSIA